MILFPGSENDCHLNGMILAFCYFDSRVVGFLSELNALVGFFEPVVASIETEKVVLGAEVEQYHKAKNSRNVGRCRYRNKTAHSEVDYCKNYACEIFSVPGGSTRRSQKAKSLLILF